MRRLVTLLTALLLAIAAASSTEAADPALSIRSSGLKVLFGHELTLSGRLSSGARGAAVAIYSRPDGQRSLSRLGIVVTDTSGRWSLAVKPTIATTYQARAGRVVTELLSVGVEPAITVRPLPAGTISSRVRAGGSFVGRTVQLQRSNGRGWTTIERARLGARSEAVFPAPSTGTATFRVAMSVNEAGRGFLGAASDAFLYRGPTLSVTASTNETSVVFGRSIILSGRVSTARTGQQVAVVARSYGSSTVHRTTVLTRPGGYWRAPLEPSIQTTYAATWDGVSSAPVGVAVHPALSVVQLDGGRFIVSVLPRGIFVGRQIELQQATGKVWKTINRRPVGPDGQADIAVPGAYRRALLRVAMSVNEAGAGYLGAASRAFREENRAVSVTTSSLDVLFGHRLELTGAISSRARGQIVSVLARPYGAPRATRVASLRTGAGGGWSVRVAPSIQTTYAAHWGHTSSRALVIGVEPLVVVRLLRHGRIGTSVRSGRSLRGRLVQLQRLTRTGRWTTVERRALSRLSSAVFSAPANASKRSIMRVALSVNQAGDGLLGAASHPFAYRGATTSAGARANCANAASAIIGLCVG